MVEAGEGLLGAAPDGPEGLQRRDERHADEPATGSQRPCDLGDDGGGVAEEVEGVCSTACSSIGTDWSTPTTVARSMPAARRRVVLPGPHARATPRRTRAGGTASLAARVRPAAPRWARSGARPAIRSKR
jgi:hypothetical protein